MKKIVVFLSGLGFLAPALSFAQTVDLNSTGVGILDTGGLFELVVSVIGKIIPILIAVGVLFFIYGVLTYIIASKPDDKAKGQQVMLYGIIGLFVMVSVWGLVAILNRTFGVNAGGVLDATNIPGVTL